MPYRGHVEDGVIVIDEPVELEEGMEVVVDFGSSETKGNPEPPQSFRERYAAVIGMAKGLPEDAAENHDHYLYGTPKK